MKVSNILGGLGALGIWKPPDQIERERAAAYAGGIIGPWDAAQSQQASQQLQDAMNQALYHGNDASKYANAQQGGWAAINGPTTQFDPVDDLIRNPFQAASIYIRLRMTKAALKEKDMEIAFVRAMGSAVHVALITRDKVVTLIDEQPEAFPSDVFVARLRLMF